MDELTQLLSGDAAAPAAGDVQPDTSSPTGFRNSRGQFVKSDASKGQPMDGMNPELVQALSGSGSPEEMEQMRRYQMMLQQRPSFAPSMPRTQAAAGAAKVPMDELSAVLAGNAPRSQPGQPMPVQGDPMQGVMPPQGDEEEGLLARLRTMGPGLQQLYGPRR